MTYINNTKPFMVLFLWFMLIYFPTYALGNSNTKGQIFFFVTYLFTIALAFIFINGTKKTIIPKNELISIVSVFILIIITFLVKLPFSNISELINHSRFLFYLFVFIFIVNILARSSVTPQQLLTGLNYTVFSLLIFNLMHLLSPSLISLINNRPIWGFRGISVGGPFVWSYIFSFFLLPIFFIYLNLLLFKFKLKFLLILLFILSCLLLGQSKASYIALVFTLFNFALLSMIYKLDNRRKVYLGILCFFIFIVSLLISFPSLFSAIINGFSAFFQNANDASTSGRLRQINIAISSVNQGNLIDVLFGVAEPKEVIENAYFSYFYKYGLFGICALIFLYMYLLIISYHYLSKAIRFKYDLISSSIFIGFNSMCISILFFSLGSSPIDANKSSYFFFFSWALVIYLRKFNETKLPIYN